MEVRIFADDKNLISGVSLSGEERLFPLTCFFFETPPSAYSSLLDHVISQKEFRNEMSAIRFKSDLDEEDMECGIDFADSEILVEHNEFGDLVIPQSMLKQVLTDYLSIYCQINSNDSTQKTAGIIEKLAKLNEI
jgi:hypothetical protein